jgi:acid phosphatase
MASCAGPDVFGIPPSEPESCKVDQAVYITRHGSRYPDPGAYNGWVSLYQKVKKVLCLFDPVSEP